LVYVLFFSTRYTYIYPLIWEFVGPPEGGTMLFCFFVYNALHIVAVSNINYLAYLSS
jgi:hypothetical protein